MEELKEEYLNLNMKDLMKVSDLLRHKINECHWDRES